VPKQYLKESDTVLLIDDFLANGCALEGLIRIVQLSGAKLAGAGAVIEKGFQGGGKRIRDQNIRLESLAIIESMDENEIKFR
jgi:xanthine phosphoribosyltransferase